MTGRRGSRLDSDRLGATRFISVSWLTGRCPAAGAHDAPFITECSRSVSDLARPESPSGRRAFPRSSIPLRTREYRTRRARLQPGTILATRLPLHRWHIVLSLSCSILLLVTLLLLLLYYYYCFLRSGRRPLSAVTAVRLSFASGHLLPLSSLSGILPSRRPRRSPSVPVPFDLTR